MALRKRGPTWHYRFQVEGKTYEGTTRTDDKRLAGQIEAERYKEVLRGTYGPKGKQQSSCVMTLEEAVRKMYEERWIFQKAGEHTRKRAELLTELMGNPDLEEIDTASIAALKTTLAARSDATVNRYLATLKTILNAAWKEWEVLQRVPLLKMAKEQHRIRTVSDEEERQVIQYFREHADEDMADLVITLVDTGMRLSEVLTLVPSQVRLKDRYIELDDTKTDTPRDIPLTQRVLSIITARCEGKSRDNVKIWPFDIHNVERRWQKARRELGINDKSFVLHALRHTTATRLIDEGDDISVVQKLLGHSTIVTSQKYINLSRKRVTAGVERLERRTARGHTE